VAGIAAIDPETHVGGIMGARSAQIGAKAYSVRRAAAQRRAGAGSKLAPYILVMVVPTIQKRRRLVTASGLRVCVWALPISCLISLN
jgi:hypothetical protein